jgi:hypothetical protein
MFPSDKDTFIRREELDLFRDGGEDFARIDA